MPKPKDWLLVENHNMMYEVGNDISSRWLKFVMDCTGKINFGYAIPVDTHADENCHAVFLDTEIYEHWPFNDPTNSFEEERFMSTYHVVEERLRLWLIEG